MTDKANRAADLQRTWALVAADADAAMELFYTTLFASAPEVRELFDGVQMAAQKRKLAAAIGLVVKSPDLPETLVHALQELGRRHVAYGVEDRHYDAVGTALIETLATALGPAFTPAARAAWTGAYATVSQLMKDGATLDGMIAAE